MAILHVFVSHFAVGGGLFLVVTERKARRNNDLALLGWLKAHTKFFVLVTVVFGAISGVGIWFTIGLIGPTATSNLIHAYVWGWAIEWVFFFVEITAALLYLYGWDKLEARLHEWYGWIYFVAAFASMVVINGIITFMLTSGSWVKNHEFWKGFFNPTYFPSLAFRFAIALALAGIYALITASVQKDAVSEGAPGAMERMVDCAWPGGFAGAGVVVYPLDSRRSVGQRPRPDAHRHAFRVVRRHFAGRDVRVGPADAGQAGADAPGFQPAGRAGRAGRDGFIRVRPRVHPQALRDREVLIRELAVCGEDSGRRRIQRGRSQRHRHSEGREMDQQS